MRMRKRIALLATGLALLILCVAGAQGATYTYGSKVQAGDEDLSRPLTLMPPGTIFAFVDTGAPGYGQEDGVYLHIPKCVHGQDPQVNDNDIRLTPLFDSMGAILKPAGSRVEKGDIDWQNRLTPLRGAVVRYMDQYGSTGYDLGDPVYLHQSISSNSPSAFETINYDVRLTNVVDASGAPIIGLAPGTKIIDLDSDRNKLLGLNLPSLGHIAYFDKNGDGFYDDGDEIYVNYPDIGSLVKVNNVRLTEVNT